jgi:asparagine synthase (glutamine-hydrolysing)
MCNEDGNIWITFNGEIYNYRELRRELISKGHRFRTKTDTETIVHLYEEEGVDCIQRLRGMFAFALWDSRVQRLLLVRDRLGKKPLVYCHANRRCIFASEIKAILQVPDVDRDLDRAALNQYLAYLYVPHPRTIFATIKKIPPAHFAIYQHGDLQV